VSEFYEAKETEEVKEKKKDNAEITEDAEFAEKKGKSEKVQEWKSGKTPFGRMAFPGPRHLLRAWGNLLGKEGSLAVRLRP